MLGANVGAGVGASVEFVGASVEFVGASVAFDGASVGTGVVSLDELLGANVVWLITGYGLQGASERIAPEGRDAHGTSNR